MAFIALSCILLVGCGGGGPSLSPKQEATKIATQAAHRRIVHGAAHPGDWYTYVRCSTSSRCMVELDSYADPGTAVAIDHYIVEGGKARLIPPSRIEIRLLEDKLVPMGG